MKKLVLTLALFATPLAWSAKTYQVTGPIVDLNDKTITVDKKGEKFEIDRGSVTSATELKKGDKVTVQYSMTATDITVKPGSEKKK